MPETDASKYAALFAHVGVDDPDDWRGVALRLAERYAPNIMNGNASARKGPGAPVKWDELREMFAAAAVEEVRNDSTSGAIRKHLPTIKSACEYLMSDTLDSCARRQKWQIPDDIVWETLYNRVSKIRNA